MTETAPRCSWHPDRETWVSCSRCGRAICPDCMRSAPVGHHCPACVAEGQSTVRQVRSQRATVTSAIIGICVAVYVLGSMGGDLVLQYGLAPAAITEFGEYYRFVTAMFLHGSLMHIVFNMLVLWQLGPALEYRLGAGRFLSLYLASGLGGGLASVLFNDPYTLSVGASGAIFGLMGAYAVLSRRLRLNNSQVLVLIGINLAIGFIVPGIDWHAHVGGLVTGAAVAAGLDLRRR